MQDKVKQMGISFLLIIIIHIVFYLTNTWKLGLLIPHVGLLFVLGLLFGPYGALGATLGNTIIELFTNFSSIMIIPSAIISFATSYLAYKLWYLGYKNNKVTKPELNNINQLIIFLSGILICGFIFSTLHGNLAGILINEKIKDEIFVAYSLNFINIAFIFGIISIWISKKIDFIKTPKISKKVANKKLYQILTYLLICTTIISVIFLSMPVNKYIMLVNVILMGIFLFGYLTKPFKHEITVNNKNTVIGKIMRIFLIIILAIAVFGVLTSILSYNFIEINLSFYKYISLMPTLIISDIVIILFVIPGITLLNYIDKNVIKPISSFSEIENFIEENEKIESDGLINVYSNYINEKNEIGTLARSYTELINHNNNYIENMREIEGEKERIKAELSIATNIQKANLPTKSIESDDYIVNGYSQAAKEVGGDFFDYYKLDADNLAIVIGDASGKGVPAALIATITQTMIKQILKHERNPSKALYSLNKQISENNAETMFLTLWIGIYNTKTKKLTFSNAGHNPPLLKENNEFRYLNIDSGLVLGITESFDYLTEEITLKDELILYTDGITDARNNENEMYGEDRLLNFLNNFNSNSDPIKVLLNDVNQFTKDTKQFDDMTLLYLKIK